MTQTLSDLPRVRRPALVNAAEYWLAPERFAQRCERLGDRFLVPMPATGAWLCLTNPDDIKQVFTGDTEVLSLAGAVAKTAPHPLVLGSSSLTNVDGDAHKRQRRMQMPPFHGQALAGYEAVMEAKTLEELARWPYGRPTRAHPLMQSIALEVIIAAVFGVTDPERVERLRKATLRLMSEVDSARFLIETVIVTTRGRGWEGPFPRIRRAMAVVDAIVLEEANERRRTRDVAREDVFAMLLHSQDEDDSPKPDDELCDAMRTLLLGGHETTASTLAWTLERLSRHPGVLARAQRAADEGDDDYVDAVVKEAMRLRPVFPITGRLTTAPFELGDLIVPVGTMVVPYITLVQRRPDLFADPLEFRPERFVGEPASAGWIAFGGGRRRCLGAAFAVVEARVVIRTILRNAQLAPTTEPPERTGRHNITVVPGRGARITLRERPPQRRVDRTHAAAELDR